MNPAIRQKNLARILFVIAVTVYATLMICVIADPTLRKLADEDGVIENATIFGYLWCMVYMLIYWPKDQLLKRGYIFALLLAFTLRELDFDKRFTTEGIFKTRFYLASEASLLEQFIGIAVITALLSIGYLFYRNHIKGRTLAQLLTHESRARVLLPLCLIIIAKSLDGISRKLSIFGIETTQRSAELFQVTEEYLELFIPISIGFALWAHQQDLIVQNRDCN